MIMTQVWAKSQFEGGSLLVLLAMADHADDNGICWPSVGRLATRSRMSERNVQLCLRKLESCGEIRTIKQGGIKGGKKTATVYRVLIGQTTGENISPVKSATGEICDKRRVKPTSPQSSGESSVQTGDEILKGGIRLAQIFGRKKINPADWSEKEQKSFKALTRRGALDDDDLAMLERYYGSNRRKTDNICRRDLFTLLNNYQGEVDRARDWCERHPAKARVVRGSTIVEPAASAVADPEQTAKFDAAFEEWKSAGRPLGEECDAIFRKHGALAPT